MQHCSLDVPLSSTMASPSPRESSERRPSHQRKVRFAPAVVIYYSNNWIEESNEFKLALWWSQDEFVSIMAKAVHTAVEARKHALLSEALDKAMCLARQVASDVGDQNDVNEYLQNNNNNNMSEDDRGLRLWCQYGHSRRGLERYTSRLYHQTQRRESSELVKQIVILSKKGAQPELIRQISERTSRSFVVLARMFGIADAKAATSQSPFSEYHQHCVKKNNPTVLSCTTSQKVVSGRAG